MRKLLATLCIATILPTGLTASQTAELQVADKTAQSTPFTCGATSVATVLRKSFGVATSEAEIAELAGTDRGATFFGMRKALKAKGFDGVGYEMTLPQAIAEVERSGAPIILHLIEPAEHFVALLGRAESETILFDPIVGRTIAISAKDLERQFSGRVLAIVGGSASRFVAVDQGVRESLRRQQAFDTVGGSRFRQHASNSLEAAPIRVLTDGELRATTGEGVFLVAAYYAIPVATFIVKNYRTVQAGASVAINAAIKLYNGR